MDFAQKACPGSNFPSDQFKALVEKIYTRWENPQAQDELLLYKQKQYIYV